MEQLDALAARLDALFAVDELERDPGFSRFVPMVYDAAGFDWRRTFQPEFVRRFNGLMLRGGRAPRSALATGQSEARHRSGAPVLLAHPILHPRNYMIMGRGCDAEAAFRRWHGWRDARGTLQRHILC